MRVRSGVEHGTRHGSIERTMRSLPILILLTAAAAQAAPTVKTIAGTGAPGSSGDGGTAAAATLNNPFGITRGPDGGLYVCEFSGNVVRRIDDKGNITTVAGNGSAGYSGDGGPAVKAQLNKPHEIRFGPDGALYISDMSTHTIRKVDMKSGTISTFAGDGRPGFGGDGGPATSAQMKDPIALQFGPDGRLYVCDIGNHRVRAIDLKTNVITTVCGNGQKAPTPDGADFSPDTPLNGPRTIDFDRSGNAWIALREGNAVYRADLKKGKLVHIAGTGKAGFKGNDGPAKAAELSGPKGLAIAPDGRVFIADTESHSIRVINPSNGRIEVVAGTGKKGSGPDGPSASCQLSRPHGVFFDKDGTLYIGDSENHVVRAVTGLK
jgi:sugar lactone lactonase YvrE